ncbi:hypothetical protein DFP72DRAFT_1152303 [Ephemerocybe angulata]|uniref:Uncharacterized protein n=1 Tax=Ephemerocybe angulata TaxID=980116 RepID=A0A8H6LZP5_9AGAR|nr:hypothetical protein DFP72DRAFT_1152303 [Tulosesus angulatus]
MRPRIIALFPIALSLASFASAHHDQTNEAREDVGTLGSRGLGEEFALERREVLQDIATRDLLDELEGRLARRRGPKQWWYCTSRSYNSQTRRHGCDFRAESMGKLDVHKYTVHLKLPLPKYLQSIA